ncbi:MAG: HAD-IC family P-type ATPase, partial [Bacteroidota bacterium]
LRLLGNKGIYLRHTDVIEQLSHITHIIFDKTGTLSTRNKDSQQLEISGHLPEEAAARLTQLTAQSTHPVSNAIHETWDSGACQRMEEWEEISGAGLRATIAGHACVLGHTKWLGEANIPLPAHAEGWTWYAEDGEILAGFKVKATYRPGIQHVIHQLSPSYSFSLLSGDHDADKQHLAPWFPKESELLFHQKPEDKRNFVETKQARDEKVLMIGDGLNDAGALRQAEVGMAITEGQHAFSPACDVIMEGEKFSLLPQLLKLSNKSMRLVRIGLLISLVYNLVGLAIAVQGFLSPLIAAILMPLSSVTIVVYGVLGSQFAARRIWK